MAKIHTHIEVMEVRALHNVTLVNDIEEVQTSTLAVNVTKEVFLFLLNHLWAKSVCREHISTGFKASGFYVTEP